MQLLPDVTVKLRFELGVRHRLVAYSNQIPSARRAVIPNDKDLITPSTYQSSFVVFPPNPAVSRIVIRRSCALQAVANLQFAPTGQQSSIVPIVVTVSPAGQ